MPQNAGRAVAKLRTTALCLAVILVGECAWAARGRSSYARSLSPLSADQTASVATCPTCPYSNGNPAEPNCVSPCALKLFADVKDGRGAGEWLRVDDTAGAFINVGKEWNDRASAAWLEGKACIAELCMDVVSDSVNGAGMTCSAKGEMVVLHGGGGSWELLTRDRHNDAVSAVRVHAALSEESCYRLADAVISPHTYDAGAWWAFPDSIAYDYNVRTGRANDTETLGDIVRTRAAHVPSSELPGPTTLVVHLRLGDVLAPPSVSGEQVFSVRDYWEGRAGADGIMSKYVRTKGAFETAIEGKLPPSVKDVVLLTGSRHHNTAVVGGVAESAEYVDLVRAFFEGRGLAVTERTGFSADDDFVYASRASYLVQSGGGYSRLIGALVAANSGTVITLVENPKVSSENKRVDKTR